MQGLLVVLGAMRCVCRSGDAEEGAAEGVRLAQAAAAHARVQGDDLEPVGFGVEQVGEFRFDASGGVSFGAGAAWHFAGAIGVELRVDSGAIDVTQEGANFRVTVRPPSPHSQRCFKASSTWMRWCSGRFIGFGRKAWGDK